MGNRDLHISGAGNYPGGEFDNVSISGAGNYPGGEFDNVSISGAGKITGDVKCVRFSGSGSAKVEGNIVCDSFSCSGAGKVIGDVEGRSVKASGACKIEGDVKCGLLSVSGATKIAGDVKGERVEASGCIKVGKDIEAEEVRITGGIKVGNINAEKVIIECENGGGSCEFNEIGATTVSINGYDKNSRPYLFKFFGLFSFSVDGGVAEGKVIEGDDIYIKNTKVDIVRGDKVTIGPNCEVGLVEYKESIQIHEAATVRETVQR